jgi:hypothetical protein
MLATSATSENFMVEPRCAWLSYVAAIFIIGLVACGKAKAGGDMADLDGAADAAPKSDSGDSDAPQREREDAADGHLDAESASAPSRDDAADARDPMVCSALLEAIANKTAIVERIAGLSMSGLGEGVLGVSGDGKILYGASALGECTFERVKLAIPTGGGSYAVHDLTDKPTLASGPNVSGLTFDGNQLIVRSVAKDAFFLSDLFGVDPRPPVAGPFTTLNNAWHMTGAALSFPVPSPDRLTLYYHVLSPDERLTGNYASVRSSTDDDFPIGDKPSELQGYAFVTGVSADDRTLFLFGNDFNTYLLTRPDKLKTFTNPSDGGKPPSLPVFQTAPLADCTLITTCGGPCNNQDVCRVRVP